MAGRDGTYPNTKIGFEQNNNNGAVDRLFCDADGYFNYDSQDVSGEQMKFQLYDNIQKATIGQGATSTVLSVKNLPQSVYLVILSMTSNLAQGSFWLTSCLQGRAVLLKLHCGSCASGSVVISTSGCSVVGFGGTDISVIHLINSTNSTALIRLQCYADNEWSVTSVANGVSLS